jgi:hypothetical protein
MAETQRYVRLSTHKDVDLRTLLRGKNVVLALFVVDDGEAEIIFEHGDVGIEQIVEEHNLAEEKADGDGQGEGADGAEESCGGWSPSEGF